MRAVPPQVAGRLRRLRAFGTGRVRAPVRAASRWPLSAIPAAALILSITVALAAAPPHVSGTAIAAVDPRPGLVVYEANCAACHGYSGEGLIGAVPPLAGIVPAHLGAPAGRAYLIGVLLHGLTGEIEVDGRTYDGLMPPWGHLGDQQLADVLNHVATAWGNGELLPPGVRAFDGLEVGLARTFQFDGRSLLRAREALSQLREQ